MISIAFKIGLALIYNTVIVCICFEGSLNDVWYALMSGIMLLPNIWASWTAYKFLTDENQQRRDDMSKACLAVVASTIGIAIVNNFYLDLYYLPLNEIDMVVRGIFKQDKRTQMIDELFTALWVGFIFSYFSLNAENYSQLKQAEEFIMVEEDVGGDIITSSNGNNSSFDVPKTLPKTDRDS